METTGSANHDLQITVHNTAASADETNDSDKLATLLLDLVEGAEGARTRALNYLDMDSGSSLGSSQLNRPTDSAVLYTAIQNCGLKEQARSIYVLWPDVKAFTKRFCHYFTPLICGSTSAPLIEESLVAAFAAYQSEQNCEMKVHAYTRALFSSASVIAGISIKSKYRRGLIKWPFLSGPITDWMNDYGLRTLVTTKCQMACTAETAASVLASQILTIDEIRLARLEIVTGGIHD